MNKTKSVLVPRPCRLCDSVEILAKAVEDSVKVRYADNTNSDGPESQI